MARRHSHVKPRKKNHFLSFLIIIILFAALLFASSNISAISDPLKAVPVIGTAVDFLDLSKSDDSQPISVPNEESAEDEEDSEDIESSYQSPLSETIRISFDSKNNDSIAPAYMIRDCVSPRRLEFTLYNVYNLDIEALTAELLKSSFVEDVYSTIVLDDSMRAFTVELSKDVIYSASEYSINGYMDLTITGTGSDDDETIYIVRSASGKMDEDMASIVEEISDFNPSIVKTKSDEYCVIAGECSTEEEAEDILSYLDDNFYIEESSIFSNPE